ncbi:hypothetical protein [Brachybacterium tyrofermentans]
MSNTEITDEQRAMLRKLFGNTNKITINDEDPDALTQQLATLFADND